MSDQPSNPNPDAPQPRMPEVDAPANIESVFEQARGLASGRLKPRDADPNQRYVVIVTPGRMLMTRPCPAPGSANPALVEVAEKILPSTVKRNVAVISYTEMTSASFNAAAQIPFLGFLLGFAYVGHAVWVFEGHPSALSAGCREADALMVDGGMVPFLQPDWKEVARAAMRGKEIVVHDRGTYQLRKV